MVISTRFRRAGTVAGLIAALAAVAAPAAADDLPPIVSVELVPHEGSRFTVGNRVYQGVLRVGGANDGLALTERVSLDEYLSGIREVPFSWPMEALSAQVVAARTYLAWTLMRGRAGNGARYGYDICATSACQVYAGAGAAEQPSGDRWIEAIDRTAGEILLYGGRPAQAVYSSSHGSRSRSNQDIWRGNPIPYLQAVDSPEAGITPYESWVVDVPSDLFVSVLKADGYDVDGRLESLLVRDPGEGEGPTSISVASTGGVDVVWQTNLRGAFNRYGARLAPGLLPTRTTNGRLPQSVPSYNYQIAYEDGRDALAWPEALLRRLPPDDLPPAGSVVFTGEGWGHGVGLSQWGARAMADDGAGYVDIVSHYYSGLVPETEPRYVPDALVVGLASELRDLTVEIEGDFEIRVNGVSLGTAPGGTWVFRSSREGLTMERPDDVPVAETIQGVRLPM